MRLSRLGFIDFILIMQVVQVCKADSKAEIILSPSYLMHTEVLYNVMFLCNNFPCRRNISISKLNCSF